MRVQRSQLLLGVLAAALAIGGGIGMFKGAAWLRWELRAEGPTGCFSSLDPQKRSACLEQEFTSIVKRDGLTKGLVQIETIAKQSIDVGRQCHPPMHALGRKSIRDFDPAQLPSTFSNNVTWAGQCTSGFLHGYMQGLGQSPRVSLEDISAIGSKTCMGMALSAWTDCFHALGHGIARKARSNLDRSIEICTKLPDTVRRECTSGAVMEVQLTKEKNYVDSKLDPGIGKPQTIDCSRYGVPDQGTCLARRVVIAGARSNDSSKAFHLLTMAKAVCDPASGESRLTCFRAVGYMYDRSLVTREHLLDLRRTCAALEGGDRDACYYGYGLGYSFDGVFSAERSWKACLALGDDRAIGPCFTGAGRGIARNMPNPKQACVSAPAKFARECAVDLRLYDISPGLF